MGANQEKDEAVEITPAMIEAGFTALRRSGLADDYSQADKCTVADIFRAMTRASADANEMPFEPPR